MCIGFYRHSSPTHVIRSQIVESGRKEVQDHHGIGVVYLHVWKVVDNITKSSYTLDITYPHPLTSL